MLSLLRWWKPKSPQTADIIEICSKQNVLPKEREKNNVTCWILQCKITVFRKENRKEIVGKVSITQEC